MAKVKMYYNVPDVEHMGDVTWEETQLRKLGATAIVADVEWGDDEIAEATIYFSAESKNIKQLLDYGCCKY